MEDEAAAEEHRWLQEAACQESLLLSEPTGGINPANTLELAP